jgi:AcrR family transcriptional regulator
VTEAQPGRRIRIVQSAASLLRAHGLHGWSVEQVATGAGCAKGLVHYHFGTRAALLAAVVGNLARERLTRRRAALAPGGTAALDALWRVLRDDVDQGVSRAWLETSLGGDQALNQAMVPAPADLDALAAAISSAMELPPLSPQRALTTLFLLDALEAALVRGAPEGEVRDAYDRVWLGML